MALCIALAPSPSTAGPSRVGPTFNASGNIGSVTTDVAYDPANDVYLMVSGALGGSGRAYGRFVLGDGTAVGPATFLLAATPTFTQQPRVAYSAALGGFLVTWLDNRDVWGRFVRYSPGGPEFTTGDFLIDTPLGGARASTSPAVTCAGAKEECLVAWHQDGIRGGAPYADVHAARIDLTGKRLGTKYFLTNDGEWQAFPAVGYDPAAGVYVVAHTYVPNTSQVLVHRIQADSGAHLGTTVLATGEAIWKPEIAFNSATGQFLVSYYESKRNMIYGRFMKSDGTVVGEIKPLLEGFNALDSNAIGYNAKSGSFLGASHGNGVEDVAVEISGAGLPGNPFPATDVRGPTGGFYPRIAAHSGRAEWMVSISGNHSYLGGQRITTDTQGDGDPNDPDPDGDTEIIDLSPAGAPNGSWFLAEGIAHEALPGFVTFYLIVNENPEAVNVRAYFSREDGKTFARTFTVAANARQTINLKDIGGVGTFGAVFQSLTPGFDIFVERSIYWGQNLEGSTGEVATKSLSTQWYFGEGSRDFFSNYFLLFNPNQVGGSATFTFFLENGTTVQRDISFTAQQRVTMDASLVEELAAQNFGVKITSTVPVVAERAMYFFGPGVDGFIGGTASIGAPALSTAWSFAEGAAAPGFHTFYLLMNPNPFPITVSRQFFLEDGTRLSGSYTVNAGSRKTVYLNDEMGDVGGAAALFESSAPFIAERSIYWGAGAWVEGTNVIGNTVMSSDWHVPEGTENGTWDSYLLIFNPTDATVAADVVVYIEKLGRFTAPVELRPMIPARTRLTINMKDFLTKMEDAGGFAPGTLSDTSFSTRVRAVDGQAIVVEHALYRTLDGANRWRTGSASFGVPR
jgi:hypothetical protein